MMRRPLFLLIAILPTACSGEQPPPRQEAQEQPAANSPTPQKATPRETMIGKKAPVAENDISFSFQGDWSGLREKCNDPSAVQKLTITPDTLVFHESVGTVQSVTPRPDGTTAVKAAFTGEGQSWTRTLSLKGAQDGQRLTIVHDGVAMTRKRC